MLSTLVSDLDARAPISSHAPHAHRYGVLYAITERSAVSFTDTGYEL